MANNQISNVNIENARIIFRNFSGKEGKYNHEGDRNFGVIIDDAALARQMADDGWNVRILKARDEDEEPRFWLPVKVDFDHIPPKVIMVTRRAPRGTPLDEESGDRSEEHTSELQ